MRGTVREERRVTLSGLKIALPHARSMPPPRRKV